MKRGFTLIELLAVIVILAIIALITVPTITGIVEKTKRKAQESSVSGWIDAVNNQIAINLLDDDLDNDLKDGLYNLPLADKYDVKVKGKEPTSGWIVIEKSQVIEYSVVSGDYVVTYKGNEITTEKGNTAEEAPDILDDGTTDNGTKIKTCPGCVYAYIDGSQTNRLLLKNFSRPNNPNATPTVLDSTQYKTNFNDLVAETGKDYFFGLVLDENNYIDKAYTCLIKDNYKFCLQNTYEDHETGVSYQENIKLINKHFNPNNCIYLDGGSGDNYYKCAENNYFVITGDYGTVITGRGDSYDYYWYNQHCAITDENTIICDE